MPGAPRPSAAGRLPSAASRGLAAIFLVRRANRRAAPWPRISGERYPQIRYVLKAGNEDPESG
jgi:hypothetical protein